MPSRDQEFPTSLVGSTGALYSAIRRRAWKHRILNLHRIVARRIGLLPEDRAARLLELPGWPDWMVDTLVRLPARFLTPYSLSPASAQWLMNVMLRRRPVRTLECGSGLSTIIIAAALKHMGTEPGTSAFESLEGDTKWAAVTRQSLIATGLSDYVGLHSTPIVSFPWASGTDYAFDVSPIHTQPSFDLLLIDAPPGALGRRGVLPSLAHLLSPGSLVVLDDAIRQGEQDAVVAWLDAGLAALIGYAPVGNGFAVMSARAPETPDSRESPVC